MARIIPVHRLAEALALRNLQYTLTETALEAALPPSTTFKATEAVHERLLSLQTNPLLGDSLASLIARVPTACTRPELIAIAAELQVMARGLDKQFEAMLVDEAPPLKPGEVGGQPRC